jgi:hypothetical protein
LVNEIILVAGAGAMACGVAVSSLMLRESALEELRILLGSGSTDSIISSRWGEEEFAAFYSMDWSADTRKSYVKLMKKLGRNEYGKSRKLLRTLIRIWDEEQEAKGKGDDGEFAQRTRTVLESYKRNEDFSGFLATFIEKRHAERM